MAMTIPYDPSLILGNLVNDAVLKNVMDMAAVQAPIDAAEDNLNSLISLKRSIDMTIQELLDMHLDTTDLLKQSDEVNKQVQTAAINYAKVKIDGLTKLMPMKAQIHVSNDSYESPIDYNKSQLKKMPLSADSLKMNVQYFSFEDNDQQSNTAALTIKSFVSDELDIFGDSFKDQASSAAQSQMNSQCWRDANVGDNPVHKTIAQLRRALGDTPAAPRYIETIRKRGYRTVAAIGAGAPHVAERCLLAIAPDGSEHELRLGVSAPVRESNGDWRCVACAGLGEIGVGFQGDDSWAAFAGAIAYCTRLGRIREESGWRFYAPGSREPMHF